MSNAVLKLIDVVEHLVNTHTHWNMDLSQVEAKAIVAGAKLDAVAEAVTPDVQKLGDDVDVVVDDVKQGVQDVKDALKK